MKATWCALCLSACGALRYHEELDLDRPGDRPCIKHSDCPNLRPICGPNKVCTVSRFVEPISTFPGGSDEANKTWPMFGPWTKWLRSVLPIFGTEYTEPAAMMEVAYFLEGVLVNKSDRSGRSYLGHPDLVSMMKENKTRVGVTAACPSANAAFSGSNILMLAEEWILQYPQCAQVAPNRTCAQISRGQLCNTCSDCSETLSHEFGHTIADWVAEKVPGFRDEWIRWFDKFDITNEHLWWSEFPAWTAAYYFQNNTGHGFTPWMWEAMKFPGLEDPKRFVYTPKMKRCFEESKNQDGSVNYTKPCLDATTRRYRVETDFW